MKKVLIDFFPILAFFVTFKFYGIFIATGVAIVATMMQVLYTLIKKEKVSEATWISLAIILLMGGATIIFHNEWFIKWKPSVLYFFFAISLVVSLYVFKLNLFKKLAGSAISLEDGVYAVLSNSWAIFFAILGTINLVVAYNFSTEIWVNFKLFGLLSITILFAVIQSVYISKNLK